METEETERLSISLQLDKVLEEIGNFGRYQLVNFILLSVPIVFIALFGSSFIFAAAEEPFRCRVPECDGATPEYEPSWLINAIPLINNTYDKCYRYMPRNNSELSRNLPGISNNSCPSELFISEETLACTSWVYGEYTSLVSEFDLGCQSWKRTLVGTINKFGQFFCMPLAGLVSDKYGRRIIVAVGAVVSGIVGLIKSFSTSYWMYLFLEFLDPLLGAGVYTAGFILAIELVGPKYRVLGGILISAFYTTGEICLGLLAWKFPYWRSLLRFVYTPSILLICYFWLVPESVRWLLTKGKTETAGQILKKAAKINRKVLSNKTLQNLYSSAEYEANEQLNRPNSGVSQVLKSKILIVRLICCSFWWITCTLVSFGLSLNSVSIGGNAYFNFILVVLIEIPGYVMIYFCLDRFGRRITICTSFLGGGIACVAFSIISAEIGWLTLLVFLFGKFNITIAFTGLYVYTTELFPTTLRHSLFSICSTIGRLGAILAPQTPLLKVYFESLPLVLFGVTSLISGIMVLFFPETNNIELPDTIEEAENISKKKKRISTHI